MTRHTARYIAAGAAGVSALLYYLIGFGVLDIGESTSGTTDLVGFGLSAGTTFAVAGLLVALIHRRWLAGAVALLDLGVIIGYFVMAGIRVPPYEVWGLSIKVAQVVLLLAVGYLVFRGGEDTRPVGAGRAVGSAS
jgi:hypothetical protein